jgi:hypothetical protein
VLDRQIFSSLNWTQQAILFGQKEWGGVASDWGVSIVVDRSGNIYTTGIFAGTGDFDPGPGSNNLTSAGNMDIFISKLDASGNFYLGKRDGWAFNRK